MTAGKPQISSITPDSVDFSGLVKLHNDFLNEEIERKTGMLPRN
jgi:hypothetical protein